MPCGYCKNRRFGGNCISSQHALVASYGYIPSSPILVTLMMGALRSSKTLVLIRVTRRNIPEDDILQYIVCAHVHTATNSSFPDYSMTCASRFQTTETQTSTFCTHPCLRLNRICVLNIQKQMREHVCSPQGSDI
jgi:hypothetical protein